jgi:hypothetical protein
MPARSRAACVFVRQQRSVLQLVVAALLANVAAVLRVIIPNAAGARTCTTYSAATQQHTVNRVRRKSIFNQNRRGTASPRPPGKGEAADMEPALSSAASAATSSGENVSGSGWCSDCCCWN